jgi:hypothetical protein
MLNLTPLIAADRSLISSKRCDRTVVKSRWDCELVQVCVKLIDVESGHIIGKTRASDYPVVESDLFSDKGQKFKYVVSFLAIKLLNEDMRYLGLVP